MHAAIGMKYLHYTLMSLGAWAYALFWAILPVLTGYGMEPQGAGKYIHLKVHPIGNIMFGPFCTDPSGENCRVVETDPSIA